MTQSPFPYGLGGFQVETLNKPECELVREALLSHYWQEVGSCEHDQPVIDGLTRRVNGALAKLGYGPIDPTHR